MKKSALFAFCLFAFAVTAVDLASAQAPASTPAPAADSASASAPAPAPAAAPAAAQPPAAAPASMPAQTPASAPAPAAAPAASAPAPAPAAAPAPLLAIPPAPEPASAEPSAEIKTFPNWKFSGIFSWSYNQNAISKNWTGKETFKRSWQAMLDVSLEREGEKTDWTTTLKESYGETDTRTQHTLSSDKIEFNTVFIYKIYRYLQPYAAYYNLSQHNKFWDPVTYMESAGLNFTFIDNSMNSLKVKAGGALRQVDSKVIRPGNPALIGNTRDVGAEGVVNYVFVFQESMKFTSDFRVFETFKKERGEVVTWDNKLFLKTGPWFTTTLGYTVYYDSSRIARHNWPEDVETMLYVSFGVSFNLFKV
ncbi:MAG: hypothetical protein LBR69_07625 [Endomicrobium sp.]|nr:hypothetical protein [Endomicrobium sp.]